MQTYKTSKTTPKYIPKKYSKHIEDWSDERNYGNGYIITLVGKCIDGPGEGNGDDCSHMFGEDSIEGVLNVIKMAYTCKCDVCESLKLN